MAEQLSDEELIRLFWGKAGKSPDVSGTLHPAVYHMIDAGMVARAIVLARPYLIGILDLGCPNPEDAIGFLCAAHDLGKISPGFQAKRADLIVNLDGKLYPFPKATIETDHSAVTQAHLGSLRGSCEDPVARALGAHHGSFHEGITKGAKYGDRGWIVARARALDLLASVFRVEPSLLTGGIPELQPHQTMVLAGLTAVADWIASDTSLFPPTGANPVPLREYVDCARDRAKTVLKEIGWDGWTPDGKVLAFSALFPAYRDGNSLQAAVAEAVTALAPESGPWLLVIEAPMGMGKTEAALYAADVFMNKLRHAGLYDALPTQATSDQMYRRVRTQYLERRIAGASQANLHLLHSLAAFTEEYAKLIEETGGRWREPTPSIDDGGGVIAASWFRGRKRGLLSPFAVGTIDQALMGVLDLRHMFVRLFGLANKVVMLDEVHAYDVYTSTILDALLRWLRRLNSSVILLSATLPSKRREELMRAYAGVDVPASVEYPRITLVPAKGDAVVRRVAAPERRVAVDRLPFCAGDDAPGQIADRLADEVADGGWAGWICNTVEEAQLAYLCAKRNPKLAGADIHLCHARFPVAWRQRIEQAVTEAFGKDAANSRDPAHRAVLIGTQVLEQALDYTVDVMVTDLAPVDLVFQRMGRMHRHAPPKTGRLSRPRILWLPPPQPPGGKPEFGSWGLVYEPYWLLLSMVALDATAELVLPRDLQRLVDDVYQERIKVPDSLAAAAQCWKSDAVLKADTSRRGGLAVALDPDAEDPYHEPVAMFGGRDELEALPSTREFEPTVTVVCAVREGGQLLDAVQRKPISLKGPLSEEEVKRLLGATVRLTGQKLERATGESETPAAWKPIPELRNHKLLNLSDPPRLGGGYVLRLDPQLGLITSQRVLDEMHAAE